MMIIAIILVYEDYLAKKVSFYIIMLPGLIFASVIVWMQTFSVTFYSRFVDSCALLRDVIYWNLCFYGIFINLICDIKSDFRFCIMIIVSITTMYVVLFLHKGQLLINE